MLLFADDTATLCGMSAAKIRILQVLPALQEGGVEQGTIELANYGTARGAHMFIASNGGKKVAELHDYVTHLPLPLHKRDPITLLINALKLARYVKQHDIQLIHARSRGPAWSCYWASLWTKVPLVTTYHGTYSGRTALKKWYNSIMLKGRRVVAISEFVFNHILSTYPNFDRDNLKIALRGADSEKFNPEAYPATDTHILRTRHSNSDEPILLLPGRLTRWKGQLDFLHALLPLIDQPWTLWLAGSGHGRYVEELKTFIEAHKLQDRVKLLGGNTPIGQLYAACDVVISASNRPEAFGRVAVEGQMMAKPVIATAHGGSLETVQHGHTGWLVKPNDSGEMTKTLDNALQQRNNWPSIGAKARTHALAQFTTAQTCAAEWAVYEEILNE